MMATDSKGNSVQFGDYVAVRDAGVVARIVKLEETPKGIKAIGAFAAMVGNGRIEKIAVDISAATLVMKSDGSLVE